MRPLVLYHGDCTDGFGAAFAAWMALGGEAEYTPVHYGDTGFRHFVAGRDVYILDFSFQKPVMDTIFRSANRVVWLDHHKTAFEMWCENERDLHVEQVPKPGALVGDLCSVIILNNNKSGALLAWEYFHPGSKTPLLFKLIDDRDRWRFDIDGSKEIHAALASEKPWSFDQWEREFLPIDRGSFTASFAATSRYSSLLKTGVALVRNQDAHVESMAKQSMPCLIRQFTGIDEPDVLWGGLAVNATLHISEVGHALAVASGTYGLVWYLAKDGKVKCSLRSNGDYDVSAIAKLFGGGGHKNAAGFETTLPTLMSWLGVGR